MKVGDLVLPDFPPNRTDWRSDWPDNVPGIVVCDQGFGVYTVMTSDYMQEVNICYLVEIVHETN